ncbi:MULTISPECIES: hypothetical protein [Leuconostoc gelidum group]|uniref:hypothetical protein n=1 Tax=Leuconostoc gelidum group TaxID=3016637 RepID=UPI00021923F0|nr:MULTISPECIES: hypothetical protein [Leuconostoc gelidum group]MBZ5943931.1 hypothetical protein [Leuconostoc gasicomitatum]MBZ5973041.1 hypothetical protein [Leuconostoc gasicomitatum]GMA66791.1 hypothetical protein GCM10025884_04180 [Leuconostoc gelidum subsp. gelidum]
MAYTFDEAIEELRLAIPEKFYQPTMHDVAVILETQNKVVDSLRKEYAPTIEMTKHEKKYLLRYLNNSSFNWLIEDIFSLETDDFEKLSDEDLMQAWLHPETIKIIEEKNNGR